MAKEILRELLDNENQYLAGNATNNNAKEYFEVELNNSKDNENNTNVELDIP